MYKTDRSTALELYYGQASMVDRFLLRSLRRFPKLRQMPTLRSHLEEALWRSARNFDPSRGAQFSTFAYHRLHGCILDLVRKRCRSKEPFIQTTSRQVDYESSEISDPRAAQKSPEDRIDIKRTTNRIRRVLATVESTSQNIVILHIIKGRSLRSIARDLAMPYSEVRRRYQKALTQVRQEMDKPCTTASATPPPTEGKYTKH